MAQLDPDGATAVLDRLNLASDQRKTGLAQVPRRDHRRLAPQPRAGAAGGLFSLLMAVAQGGVGRYRDAITQTLAQQLFFQIVTRAVEHMGQGALVFVARLCTRQQLDPPATGLDQGLQTLARGTA